MGAITRSVGAGGKNEPADVSEIQRLLNLVPVSQGGAAPPFFVFGTCDPATQAAILRFQKIQVPVFADGRIDPGGPTLARLNALAAPPTPGGGTGSLSDVTRARGIAKLWLAAVEPSISGFIFSVSNGLSPAQAPFLLTIEEAFQPERQGLQSCYRHDLLAVHPRHLPRYFRRRQQRRQIRLGHRGDGNGG